MSNTQYKDQEYLIKLGKHIESYRVKSGKSYDDFAKLCGLDRRQLRRIEKAETNSSISLLKKIADNLKLSIPELLNF
ncbi:helix-turn-helix transcriptional regulator [Sphingobacterium sp. SGL-16]|uniref:helix-turn-helix transcriptional regulator n=1 Tax=Sphingobacterium sp. SGL-16 TaxID=2710883 RepID=UPI0013EA2746|nr:helix-turn-helix transcriptional regulator [Sphingobacterium sp. SGL-16]NGM72831.1 helix-turn-helix transcriptional regulator [Sphingobacterium sp. SGL-16]